MVVGILFCFLFSCVRSMISCSVIAHTRGLFHMVAVMVVAGTGRGCGGGPLFRT